MTLELQAQMLIYSGEHGNWDNFLEYNEISKIYGFYNTVNWVPLVEDSTDKTRW